MIRNVLYSLFLHSILIIAVYSSFSFNSPIEIDKTTTVAINFVNKATENSNNKNAILQVAQGSKSPVLAPLNPISKKKASLIKKVEPKPKKSKPKQKQKSKSIEKKLEVEPKIVADKALELKKNDVIKPEEKEPDIKKEEIKKELEEKEVELETEDDTEDQEDENQYSFTENDIESLDLLVREKFNIQNQIKRCYQNALKEEGDNKMTINVHIFIAQDGFIDLDSIIFKEFAQYKKSSKMQEENKYQGSFEEYKKALETVRKALKFCSPVRNLPQDKYNIWKEIDLQFN